MGAGRVVKLVLTKEVRHLGLMLAVARLSDGISVIHLAAYCLQLEMIRDRLDQHVPLDDETWTEAQRQHWSRACGFLKAASTSLVRLVDASNERLESEIQAKQGRRSRTGRRRDSPSDPT